MIAVSDILEHPLIKDKYSTLKKALIDRIADSQELQLKKLLSGIELGSKKPSLLLREMRNLSGVNASENLLKTSWLQRLPSRLQELLIILEDTTLNKLSEAADKA